MTEVNRAVLIDGHSLAYRAFYALPSELATSSGQTTNAVYGFTSMLIKVLEEFRPKSIIVAFDKGRPEFRTEKFAQYKAHRKPMPDELREQIDIIHAVLEAINIPWLEEEGYEADDVLATLTRILPDDVEVYIVTGDRDAFQLVSERVKVIANRKGITDIVVYDAEKVKEKYGVSPGQIVDYLALKGDASDNIPGVPGIGEKTAAALISEYGSLDGVYANLQKIKSGRWKKILEENRESAYMSRELAWMRRDAPIMEEAKPAQWELKPWKEEDVRGLFASLEFRNLYERLMALRPVLFHDLKEQDSEKKEQDSEKKELRPATETIIEDRESLDALYRSIKAYGELSLWAHMEGDGFTRGKMGSMSFVVADHTFRFDLSDNAGKQQFQRLLDMLVADKGIRLNCYRGKDIMVQCAKLFGIYTPFDFDVQLASYLINPSGVKHDLDSSMLLYLEIGAEEKPPGQLDLIEAERERGSEEMRLALAVDRLIQPMEAEMHLRNLRSLYDEVEMPLQAVLAEMEIRGVRLDRETLRVMEEEMNAELKILEEEAFSLAGEEFNLNSPQQLSRIFFDVLNLPPVKRTKTGYATDVGVLNILKDRHPLAKLLLRYRELSKLLNTYVSALPRLLDPITGRLHTCFNQTITATGRLSSSNPNLQNIPIRTPLGKRIRKAFLPTSADGAILSADYSQIELRILAHISGDAGLKRAFDKDLDIHAATASEVFGLPFDQVTPEHRRKAKTINFGIIYGISPYGLAEQLGILREEAEAYIASYFKRYPGVRFFLDKQVEKAAANGYIATLLGRRREIPELADGNVRMRHLGERLAFNTPIQGSAADIIKLAMLRIHRRMEDEGLRSHMILQVHDELVFDVENAEVERVKEIVIGEMEGAYDLDVPLKVEVGIGPSWYDTK